MIVYRLGLNGPLQQHSSSDTGTRDGEIMGLVKTRRLAAMRKQQRAKAGMKPKMPKQALRPGGLQDPNGGVKVVG